MSVYIAPKKWPALDDNPSPSEISLNLRRVFNTLNDHDQAINTVYANGLSSTATTSIVTQAVAAASSSTAVSGVTSFNGSTGAIIYYPYLGSVDNQTSVTTYTTQTQDGGSLLLVQDASPVAITLNFNVSAPWYTTIYNLGPGTATLTPNNGNVNGVASVLLYGGSFAIVFFDGSNFWSTLVPIATTSQLGIVMPDGVTIDIASGVISVPTATTSSLGLVQPDGTTIKITSGGIISVPIATYSTLGLIEAVAAVSHEWINSINLSGVPQLSQPAFSDISGTASPSQLPIATTSTLGAVEPDGSTIHVTSGGVISVPTATNSSLGLVEAIAPVSHKWINSINSSGVPQLSQPAASDLSDGTTGTGAVVLATGASVSNLTATGTLSVTAAATFTSTVTAPDAPILTAPTTTTSATAGSATALPATPAGYLSISLGGTIYKIPFYSS